MSGVDLRPLMPIVLRAVSADIEVNDCFAIARWALRGQGFNVQMFAEAAFSHIDAVLGDPSLPSPSSALATICCLFHTLSMNVLTFIQSVVPVRHPIRMPRLFDALESVVTKLPTCPLEPVLEYFLANVIGLQASGLDTPPAISLSLLHLLGVYLEKTSVILSWDFQTNLFRLSQSVWSLVRSEKRPNNENRDVLDSLVSVLAEFVRAHFPSPTECRGLDWSPFLVDFLKSDEPALIRVVARCIATADEKENLPWRDICQHFAELKELDVDQIHAPSGFECGGSKICCGLEVSLSSQRCLLFGSRSTAL
jgi:hypothetical protein